MMTISLAARKQFSKGYISLLCWISWIYRRNRRNAYSLELSDKFWVRLNKRIQNLTVSNFVGCRRTFCLCHLKWKANAIDRLCRGLSLCLNKRKLNFPVSTKSYFDILVKTIRAVGYLCPRLRKFPLYCVIRIANLYFDKHFVCGRFTWLLPNLRLETLY